MWRAEAVGSVRRGSYGAGVFALVLDGRPRLVNDHHVPERPAGEARIALELAGVCDTDLQLVRGYMAHRGVLGHEFVGRVLQADDPRWVGRRVVADINAGCGRCPRCLEGDGHHCPHRTVLGIAGRDGALAEEFLVPERCLVTVPDSVTNDRAVFAEPLAAAAHVLDESRVADAPRVVVLGDGKLGLLIALVMVAAGKETTLVGHHPHKLAIAARAGAQVRLEAEAQELPRADVVVEATGSSAGLTRALELVVPRGTIVLKTTVADPLGIDFAPVVINELCVVGSRCGNLARALELLARGSVDPRPLIAARYPLAAAEAALEHAARRGTLKVLVEG